MSVADKVKSALRTAGIDVRRYRPAERRRAALMERVGIRTVLDVGANVGQYGREIRAAGFRGRIVSVEPLDDAFRQLSLASASDDRWTCVNVAASDRAGTSTIHVAANSASSSLLPMASIHAAAAPEARTTGTRNVTLSRLDDLDELRGLPPPWMIKLDVQGHEAAALRGAEGILHRVSLVELELSVRELYDGAPVLREMLGRMSEYGYELVRLEPGFHDPRDGTILQFDGLFERFDSPQVD